MLLDELVSIKDLNKAIEEGYIRIVDSSDGYLIYNYTALAMVRPESWNNAAVLNSRGLIVDSEDAFKIKARPWEKFFNYQQNEAGVLDYNAPVEITNKMDGSLGVLYLNRNGQPRVATRGSFHSEMAVWANKWLQDNPKLPYPSDLETVTLLVEIIYPENRIVVDYEGYAGLVLLGGVNIETGEYYGPNDPRLRWDGDRTEVYGHGQTLTEALAMPPREGAEGLCVRFLDQSKIVKIKQADYLALHKLLFSISRKAVWELAMNHHENLSELVLEEYLSTLPDEFQTWVRSVWEEILNTITHISAAAVEAAREVSSRFPFGTADFAKCVKLEYADIQNFVFTVAQGKSLNQGILRSIREDYRGDSSPFSGDPDV